MKAMHLIFGVVLLTAFAARSEVRTELVTYKEGATTLEGLLAYDDAVKGRRPGILVAHQWKGRSAYETKRAEMLARLGYVVFALDIYGQGVRAETREEAAGLAARYKEDRALLRKRAQAGLAVLKKNEWADPNRVAAIGYCFGGTTVLELARDGADIRGVVSFHGGLSTPKTADAKKVRGSILVLHGADDPHVPAAEVAGFEEEMRQAKVDWQLVAYGGAVHSFTDWNAGSDLSKGSAYNEKADKRSWEAMKTFFEELFAGKK